MRTGEGEVSNYLVTGLQCPVKGTGSPQNGETVGRRLEEERVTQTAGQSDTRGRKRQIHRDRETGEELILQTVCGKSAKR